MKKLTNIKNILKDNGLEIVSHIKMKYLRLKFIESKVLEMKENEDSYDFDIEGEFNVVISDIGFSEEGEIYIVFTCMDDEHFEKGNTFEVIAY